MLRLMMEMFIRVTLKVIMCTPPWTSPVLTADTSVLLSSTLTSYFSLPVVSPLEVAARPTNLRPKLTFLHLWATSNSARPTGVMVMKYIKVLLSIVPCRPVWCYAQSKLLPKLVNI